MPDSTASVKVDEFFHSTRYFQWCVRRFKKSLASSLPEDQDGADAKGVIDDSLAFPVMKANGILEFGMVTHNPKEESEVGRSGNAMSCWTHRINRDPDKIFETCHR